MAELIIPTTVEEHLRFMQEVTCFQIAEMNKFEIHWRDAEYSRAKLNLINDNFDLSYNEWKESSSKATQALLDAEEKALEALAMFEIYCWLLVHIRTEILWLIINV